MYFILLVLAIALSVLVSTQTAVAEEKINQCGECCDPTVDLCECCTESSSERTLKIGHVICTIWFVVTASLNLLAIRLLSRRHCHQNLSWCLGIALAGGIIAAIGFVIWDPLLLVGETLILVAHFLCCAREVWHIAVRLLLPRIRSTRPPITMPKRKNRTKSHPARS